MTVSSKPVLSVLAVASEIYPVVKTGGLADVAGALPAALASEGIQIRTLVPGYPSVLAALATQKLVASWPDLFGGPVELRSGTSHGLDLLVLDAPHLYHRSGNPYLAANGLDWPDNLQRFAALSRVAAWIGQGRLEGYHPAVIHAHDWQAGLAPAYLELEGGPRPATVITVHNLAFQGLFPVASLGELGLPASSFSVDGVEFHGQVGFLKAGLRYADRITTVSPTYAAEITTPEGGMGLDGLLRGRSDRLTGILNGIDTEVWNPATDPRLAARYDRDTIGRRGANKAALQAFMGLLVEPVRPLFGVISRLTAQKGLDLLAEALPALLATGGQLALLGSGDATLQAAFMAAADRHPGRVAVRIGYDELLAHQIQAGADALLVPSRFEPCGLTQLCALRYGAVPVVARVGGLADTVIDANPMAVVAGVATGVQFSPVTATALAIAIQRAAALFADGAGWRRIQQAAMATDVSWSVPARTYARMYRDVTAANALLAPHGGVEAGAAA